MNNIATPSNYYYDAIEQSTYPPLVPVQLLIRQQQKTGLCREAPECECVRSKSKSVAEKNFFSFFFLLSV